MGKNSYRSGIPFEHTLAQYGGPLREPPATQARHRDERG